MSSAVIISVIGLFCCTSSRSGLDQSKPALARPEISGLSPEISAAILAAYDQANTNRGDPETVGKFAMLLHAHGRLEAAADAYMRCRELDPGAFRWAYYLGSVQASLGKHAAAVSSLRAALEIQPGYAPASIKLAETLLAGGQPEASRDIYLALPWSGRESAIVLLGLGRAYQASGDRARAISSYESAIKKFAHYGAAHYALALAYRDAGRAADSERHLALFRANQNAAPSVDDPLQREIDTLRLGPAGLIGEGVRLSAEGRLDQAAAAFEKALESAPGDLSIHANLISVYGRKGDYERAGQHFRKASEIDPGSVDAQFNWGVVLARQQRFDEASRLFLKVLEANPQNPDANTNLGYIRESEGRSGEAAKLYRRALESEPDHAAAHFRLGRLDLAQGQIDKAISHFRQASQTDSELKAEALYGLAAAFSMKGDAKQAASAAREALAAAQAHGRTDLEPLIQDDLRKFEQSAARQR